MTLRAEMFLTSALKSSSLLAFFFLFTNLAHSHFSLITNSSKPLRLCATLLFINSQRHSSPLAFSLPLPPLTILSLSLSHFSLHIYSLFSSLSFPADLRQCKKNHGSSLCNPSSPSHLAPFPPALYSFFPFHSLMTCLGSL